MGEMAAITSKPVVDLAPALVEVAALTKRYRDEIALGDVSFDVRAREVLGLIGPNGAGKTTLLETIAGVLPADAGSIRWRGAPLPSPRRRDFMFYLPDGLRPWDDQYTGRVLAEQKFGHPSKLRVPRRRAHWAVLTPSRQNQAVGINWV